MSDSEFHVMAWPLAAMSFIVHRHLQNLERVLGTHELTVPHWRVLNALSDRDGLSVRDVAAHAAIELREIQPVVIEMSEAGLIDCAISATDAENSVASLTQRGRELFNEIVPAVKDCHAQSLEGIDDDDFDALLRLLGQIQTNVYGTDFEA